MNRYAILRQVGQDLSPSLLLPDDFYLLEGHLTDGEVAFVGEIVVRVAGLPCVVRDFRGRTCRVVVEWDQAVDGRGHHILGTAVYDPRACVTVLSRDEVAA